MRNLIRPLTCFTVKSPGTGCNDAPRCFSLKLAQVTRNLCGLKPSTVDGELCMKHKVEAGRPKLVVITTKHLDDIKLAGVKEEVIAGLQQIEKVFGKLNIEWNEFTNCGVRNRQHKTTREITLDQNEYAASLRTIAHADLSGKKSEDEVSPELRSLYRSLLGAVAFLLLTRIDVAVFVSALQRRGHAPKIMHVKRLHVLRKWIRANPKCLVYKVFVV